MAENKILKTLTLPNAQGELVKYELHPEWDNIEGKPDSFVTNWNDIPDKPETYPTDWEDIANKPDSFGGVGEFYEVDGTVKGEIFNDYNNNVASGLISHAEGGYTTASGNYSHAEGQATYAHGDYSHTEGLSTHAYGDGAHTEGTYTYTHGCGAHAEGVGTKAFNYGQHVQGTYNIIDPDQDEDAKPETRARYAHIVGNGTSENARSNAHTLDWDGNAWYAGHVQATKMIVGEISYGTQLPTEGIEGQLFFLIGGKTTGSVEATDNGNGIITLG